MNVMSYGLKPQSDLGIRQDERVRYVSSRCASIINACEVVFFTICDKIGKTDNKILIKAFFLSEIIG